MLTKWDEFSTNGYFAKCFSFENELKEIHDKKVYKLSNQAVNLMEKRMEPKDAGEDDEWLVPIQEPTFFNMMGRKTSYFVSFLDAFYSVLFTLKSPI